MFENKQYKYDQLRKYTVVFGALFDNVRVTRKTKSLKVPLMYGPGRKYIKKREDVNSIDGRKNKTYPLMSFAITSFLYDNIRQGNKNNIIQNGSIHTHNRVPYNIYYDLNIKAKSIEDINEIIEQILPYFTPNLHVVVEESPELDVKSDINIKLESVSLNDEYMGSMEDDEVLEMTLNFVLEGFLYQYINGLSGNGVPNNDGTVIKHVLIDYENLNGLMQRYEAEVNPFEANENDPHTIDETYTEPNV